MTPDFRTELRQAADDHEAPPPADPRDLLARGQARARRRRRTATLAGLGLVAAAVVAISLGASALTSSSPDHPTGSVPPATGQSTAVRTTAPEAAGLYTPQVVASDDVVDQCREQIRNWVDPHANWHVQGPNAGPFFAGDAVPLVAPGTGIQVCNLPPPHNGSAQSGTVRAKIATADDPAGILDQCGIVAGYDFTGWTVDSAMSEGRGTEAMLVSDNGYVTSCALQPAGWDSGAPQDVEFSNWSEHKVVASRKKAHSGQAYAVWLDASSLSIKTAYTPISGVLLYGTNTLYTKTNDTATNAATVTLSTAGGQSITRPVVNGHVAIRWHIPNGTTADVPYDVVVKDDLGAVLAHYNSQDTPGG